MGPESPILSKQCPCFERYRETYRYRSGEAAEYETGSGKAIHPARESVLVRGDHRPASSWCFGEGQIAQFHENPAVRYRLVFGAQGDSFVVLDERLENASKPSDKIKPFFYFGYENGRPMLNVQDGRSRELRRETLDMSQSILSQHKDPEKYPELGRLTDVFGANPDLSTLAIRP